MNKKFTALLCVLLAAVMLLGACAKQTEENAKPGAASNINDEFVVVTVNGEPIYYGEYYPRFASACAQYGISEDDETYSAFIKESILESLINEKIMKQYLTEKGYMDLTAEQNAKAESDAQAELDMMINYYYAATIESELGENYTDEDYAQAKTKYEDELLAGTGFSREDLIGLYKLQMAEAAAKDALVGDLLPSEEQVREKYDEYVAAEKEIFDETPSMYESDIRSGDTVYYTPENVREVRHILIKFDDDIFNAIALLRNEKNIVAKNMLREKALADIEEFAQGKLNMIQQKSFDEMYNQIVENTEEPAEREPTLIAESLIVAGTKVAQELLAKVSSDEMSFSEAVEAYNKKIEDKEVICSLATEFYLGAVALGSTGEFSVLIGTDFGYHIIEYYMDIEAGAVDFESVRDEIYESLLDSIQDDQWNALLEEWTNAADIVYTEEKF